MPTPLPTTAERLQDLHTALFYRTLAAIVLGGVAAFAMIHGHYAEAQGRAEGRREMAVACGLNRDTVHQQGLPSEITQALGQVSEQDEPFLAQMQEYRRQQEAQRAKEAAERLKAHSTPGKPL